jgi:hypothetical protein
VVRAETKEVAEAANGGRSGEEVKRGQRDKAKEI